MGDVVNISTKTGTGRRKQPLEKRKILSDRPHLNRKGPPDVEMSTTLGMGEVPADPPHALSYYEKECWRMIVDPQRGDHNSKWIYSTDVSYVVGVCALYARAMELRKENNKLRRQLGGHIDPGEMRLNPGLKAETSAWQAYLSGLERLGMAPTRRQVTLGQKTEDPPVEDELLA